MMRATSLSAFRALARRFAREDRAVAAVEFAFVLPLMVLCYLGCVFSTMAVTMDRKVTLLTRTIGDLTAQVTSVTLADMTDIFNAATTVLYPYVNGTLKMRVTDVRINGASKACVQWSHANVAGFELAQKLDVTNAIPPSLLIPNTYLIVARVEVDYQPVAGKNFFGPGFPLHDELYMRPRQSDEVTAWDQPPVPCN
jgi:Flp pilus assembly protein TadG